MARSSRAQRGSCPRLREAATACRCGVQEAQRVRTLGLTWGVSVNTGPNAPRNAAGKEDVQEEGRRNPDFVDAVGAVQLHPPSRRVCELSARVSRRRRAQLSDAPSRRVPRPTRSWSGRRRRAAGARHAAGPCTGRRGTTWAACARPTRPAVIRARPKSPHERERIGLVWFAACRCAADLGRHGELTHAVQGSLHRGRVPRAERGIADNGQKVQHLQSPRQRRPRVNDPTQIHERQLLGRFQMKSVLVPGWSQS